MQNEQIVSTIEKLRERLDERFDQVDKKFDEFSIRYDSRLRDTEKSVTQIKTFGGLGTALVAFLGWGQIKSWLTILLKS